MKKLNYSSLIVLLSITFFFVGCDLHNLEEDLPIPEVEEDFCSPSFKSSTTVEEITENDLYFTQSVQADACEDMSFRISSPDIDIDTWKIQQGNRTWNSPRNNGYLENGSLDIHLQGWIPYGKSSVTIEILNSKGRQVSSRTIDFHREETQCSATLAENENHTISVNHCVVRAVFYLNIAHCGELLKVGSRCASDIPLKNNDPSKYVSVEVENYPVHHDEYHTFTAQEDGLYEIVVTITSSKSIGTGKYIQVYAYFQGKEYTATVYT